MQYQDDKDLGKEIGKNENGKLDETMASRLKIL